MKFPKCFSVLCLCVLLFACKSPQPRHPIRVSHSARDAISVRISRRVYIAERKALQAYARRTGLAFRASELDFSYALVDSSRNRPHEHFPHGGEVLSLVYTLCAADGKPIYGRVEKRVKLDHPGIPYGLNEGLKLLKPGDSAIFLIPSHMAFGFHGDGQAIAPNTPLVIQVKLKQTDQNL